MTFSSHRPGPLRWLVLLLLAFCAVAFLNHASAQTNPVPSNRWLFIVDTSRGMQSRAEAARQIAASLVDSGMRGQMRPGDSIGLWTFNDELHSGQFPLQEWKPDDSRVIARRVFEFLGSQKNEKDSQPEKIMPELKQVITASEFITVVLISDGSKEIHGTPFDARINSSYQAWREQQEKSAMPFVTLLRARDGKIAQYVVNTPPFPFDLPALPEELLKPRAVKPAVAEVEKPEPAKPRVVPPLILSGKKPEPAAETPPPVAAESPAIESKSTPSPASVEQTPTPVPAVAPPPTENSVPESPVSSSTNTEIASADQLHANRPPESPVVIETAVSAAPESKRKGFWLLASIVLGGLVVITFLVLRSARKSSQASLITRSLDRDSH